MGEDSNRKKIVFVINNFVIGGVEKLLLDVISRLDQQNFTVSIITVFGSGPLEARFRELNIPIYFAAGKLSLHNRRLPYKTYWLLIAPVVLVKLIIWFWWHKPNVIVTSLYQADILGMLASWLAGVPKRVLIHHDTYPLGRSKTWLKQKFGIGLATKIVAVSEAVKDFVINYFGALADRIVVIPNGINTYQFSASNKSPNYPYLVLGMLGRLEPVKDPLIFVQALQILQTKFGLAPPSYLGGDGSLRSELADYVSQNHLTNLQLDGEIRDVSDWLKKIDVLVVPSLNEGFGLVVLEGLAAGKLTVASDLSAIRELITDGVNGQLFSVRDTASLASILQHLLTDPVSFNQIQQGIRKWQQQHLPHYDISRVTHCYEQLLLS